jgi:CDP-diacylglycerol pyrophosphatase
MKKQRLLMVALLAAPVFVAAGVWLHGRSALWRIVSEDCLPAARAGRASACAIVSPPDAAGAGYAVLKDRHGALQYLLIPTTRVTGIEDPALLQPGAGAWLAAAWRERRWMETARHAPVPREDVALALNSEWARSQDQLHVHVSCVRPDLRVRLDGARAEIGAAWSPLAGGWNGHPYAVRRIAAADLDGTDLFRELARLRPGSMGGQAIAVVGDTYEGRPSLVVLATHVDLASAWLGGIEGDVQDHGCAVLGKP